MQRSAVPEWQTVLGRMFVVAAVCLQPKADDHDRLISARSGLSQLETHQGQGEQCAACVSLALTMDVYFP